MYFFWIWFVCLVLFRVLSSVCWIKFFSMGFDLPQCFEFYLPLQLRRSIKLYALLSRAEADFCCSTYKLRWWVNAIVWQLQIQVFSLTPGRQDEDCFGRCCFEDPGSRWGRRGTFWQFGISFNSSVKFNSKWFVPRVKIIKGTLCSGWNIVWWNFVKFTVSGVQHQKWFVNHPTIYLAQLL